MLPDLPKSPAVKDALLDTAAGMDSGRAPHLIGPNHSALLVNGTFRGGQPHTRPGFKKVMALESGYYQGATSYFDPRNESPAVLIMIAGGKINKIDPIKQTSTVIYTGLDTIRDCYFCQAEKYLIIQNGAHKALVYDGSSVRTIESMHADFPTPIGSIMAYGQGRLFVASPDRTSITAGDLIFGGSETRIDITKSSIQGDATIFYTRSSHTLRAGDTVTLGGHKSDPEVNGTFLVSFVPNSRSFRLEVQLNKGGSGGYVIKANPGAESDVLRFSENSYLFEGGSFKLPAFMGKITGMTFIPIQDSTTGQGDLVVFCENGTASFAVSQPRNTWKLIPFQRVLFRDIGATSPTSLATVNSDVFFRSDGGVRNYRNARAELEGYGRAPLSSELTRLFKYDTEWMLGKVSAIQWHNRLLMTASPRVAFNRAKHPPRTITAQSGAGTNVYTTGIIPHGFVVGDIIYVRDCTRIPAINNSRHTISAVPSSTTFSIGSGAYTVLPTGSLGTATKIPAPEPLTHQAIAVMDFHSTAFNAGKASSAWDGIWTGLNILQLVAGTFGGFNKAYMLVRTSDYLNELWEIDEARTMDQNEPIAVIFESRCFSFSNPFELKKLFRADFWFSDIRGMVDVTVQWRSDYSPTWINWQTLSLCANIDNCEATDCDSIPNPKSSYSKRIKLPNPEAGCNATVESLTTQGFFFQIRVLWNGHARLEKFMLHALMQPDSSTGVCQVSQDIECPILDSCEPGFFTHQS